MVFDLQHRFQILEDYFLENWIHSLPSIFSLMNNSTLVSSALDVLCRYLQNELRPHVRRIVKSGSMGKGTALKNSSDLDCVLIMNIFTNPLQLKVNIRAILSRIQSCLIIQPLLAKGWMFYIKKVDEYLLQFEMFNIGMEKATKVDLLPTFDANVTDGQARMNLYNKIMPALDENTRSYCSVALAELQRDFIIEKPAQLKNLIRLVKHWAKTYLPSSTSTRRMPSSYLIELVTIHFWEEAGSLSSFSTAALFMVIMIVFCNHTHLDISWNRYYTLSQTTSLARIVDPANPCSNLYDDVTDWATVAQVARQTLQMPVMELFIIALAILCQDSPALAILVLAYWYTLYS